MTIGESIRKVREEKGYSRERLSRAAKVSHTAILQWEYDKASPTASLLWRVADVLKVSLDELVGRGS